MFLKHHMVVEAEAIRWLMLLTLAAALVLAFASQAVGELAIWT